MSRTLTRSLTSVATLTAAASLAAPALAATTAKPTSLTLRAAHSTVAPSQKDTLTGTLKAGTRALAGETVRVEKRTPGAKTFTLISRKSTDSKAHVVLTVTPGTRKGQKEQYVLVFAGNKTYKASRSNVITVTVS